MVLLIGVNLISCVIWDSVPVCFHYIAYLRECVVTVHFYVTHEFVADYVKGALHNENQH